MSLIVFTGRYMGPPRIVMDVLIDSEENSCSIVVSEGHRGS